MPIGSKLGWFEIAAQAVAAIVVGRRGRGTIAMEEKHLDGARRWVLRGVFNAGSAALLLRFSRAQAADKMTRQQAQYQDTPNGIYSCAVCTLFERPNSCKVVDGEVSKDGWCKAFAMAD